MKIKKAVMFCIAAVLLVVLYQNYKKVSNVVQKPIILVYHSIQEKENAKGDMEYVTPAEFERQMTYLAEHGFLATSLEDHGKKKLENTWRNIVITFDDTWESQYEIALPILKKHGFGATFFINSSWVGKQQFMSWDTVRAIVRDPDMEIGGHTQTHAHLFGQNERVLKEEVIGDKEYIEREIGSKIHSFAYPYGEEDAAILSVVKNAGYDFGRIATVNEKNSTSNFMLPATVVSNNFEAFMAAVAEINYGEMRKVWKKEMSDVGAVNAYSLLKKQYMNAPHNIAHNAAHIFGEILYDKGLENIEVCDSTFIFGCYHGLLGRAINKRGIEVLPELDKACKKKGREWLGCHHGMGHGIMSYFGDERLFEALDACARLSWKGPVAGCYGGLFMEYNFRNAHIEEKPYVREYHGDPYEPCVTLPEKFKNACYYEQPDWWRKIFKNDYKKLGELCTGIETSEHQEYCFIGVGRMAAQSMDYNEAKTVEECDRMSLSESIALCRAGGFLSIFDKTTSLKNLSICSGLAPEYSTLCLEKAQMFMK